MTTISKYVSGDELDTIDWSKTSLDVGIKRGDGTERWLPLDQADLRILAALLERPIIEGLVAAEASEGLGALCRWAKAAHAFSERNNLP